MTHTHSPAALPASRSAADRSPSPARTPHPLAFLASRGVVQRGQAQGGEALPNIDVAPIDAALGARLDGYAPPDGVTVFLYAVGSYGRKELRDGSDLDYHLQVVGGSPEEQKLARTGLHKRLQSPLRVGAGKHATDWELEEEASTPAILAKKNNSLVVTGRLLRRVGAAEEPALARHGGVNPNEKRDLVVADLKQALAGAVQVKTGLYHPFMKGLIMLGVDSGKTEPAAILADLGDPALKKAYASIQKARAEKSPRKAKPAEQAGIVALLELLSAAAAPAAAAVAAAPQAPAQLRAADSAPAVPARSAQATPKKLRPARPAAAGTPPVQRVIAGYLPGPLPADAAVLAGLSPGQRAQAQAMHDDQDHDYFENQVRAHFQAEPVRAEKRPPFAFRYAPGGSPTMRTVTSGLGGLVHYPNGALPPRSPFEQHQQSYAEGVSADLLPGDSRRLISQNDVMGNVSATEAARQLGLDMGGRWEWLHLVAFSIGQTHVGELSADSATWIAGTGQVQQIRENLVLGTAAANTEMLNYESEIKRLLQQHPDWRLDLGVIASKVDRSLAYFGKRLITVPVATRIGYHFRFAKDDSTYTAPIIVEFNPQSHQRPASASFTQTATELQAATQRLVTLAEPMRGLATEHLTRVSKAKTGGRMKSKPSALASSEPYRRDGGRKSSRASRARESSDDDRMDDS